MRFRFALLLGALIGTGLNVFAQPPQARSATATLELTAYIVWHPTVTFRPEPRDVTKDSITAHFRSPNTAVEFHIPDPKVLETKTMTQEPDCSAWNAVGACQLITTIVTPSGL